MKKINLLLAIVIAAILTACSGSSLESKAKERYEKLFASKYGNVVSSYTLSDEVVSFAGDSICVLLYKVEAVSFTGKSENSDMEYVIMRYSKGDLYEFTYPVEYNIKSIFVDYQELYHKPFHKGDKECEKLLKVIASFKGLMRSSKVPE